MVGDPEITKAISRVLQRSEKQLDEQKLINSFVDIGILLQLRNANNQVFYGRRGTGKTHVLKVLAKEIEKENSNNIVLYIDGRTLGSTSQFSDQSISFKYRCLSLFRDVLSPIYSALLEKIVDEANKNAEKALTSADHLLSSIVEPTKKYKEDQITKAFSKASGNESFKQFSLCSDPKVDLGLSKSNKQTSDTQIKYTVSTQDKVVFPTL